MAAVVGSSASLRLSVAGVRMASRRVCMGSSVHPATALLPARRRPLPGLPLPGSAASAQVRQLACAAAWPATYLGAARLGGQVRVRLLCGAAASDSGAAEAGEPFYVVNFYHLVELADPEAELAEHRAFLQASGTELRGRIYVTPQGVNAQYSGSRAAAVGYAQWLAARRGFEGLSFSADPASGHAFPALRLKTKPNLVSLRGGHAHLPITDPAARATKLSPRDWKAMLSGGGSGLERVASAVVLDVRNAYEWDAGHFQGAERPVEEEFRETPVDAEPPHLAGVPRDAPVMMYCTGGIRCDVYSAALRKQGFTNLYTLEGGIANYLRTEGGDLWDGSLFVFDSRNVLPGDLTAGEQPRELRAAAPCQLCGAPEPALPHLNCANIDCNKLFLACDACKAKLQGCCCDACTRPPRMLRPLKEDGYYARWTEYGDSPDSMEAIASGRGEGRRRRRTIRKAARKAETDAEKAARKAMARKALAQMADRDEEGARREQRAAAGGRLYS